MTMRPLTKVVVGVGIGAVALGVFWVAGQRSAPQPGGAASLTPTQAPPEVQRPAQARPPRYEWPIATAQLPPTPPAPSRRLEFASKPERAPELEALRREIMDQYRWFVTKARLTEEQDQALRAAIADAQENLARGWDGFYPNTPDNFETTLVDGKPVVLVGSDGKPVHKKKVDRAERMQGITEMRTQMVGELEKRAREIIPPDSHQAFSAVAMSIMSPGLRLFEQPPS